METPRQLCHLRAVGAVLGGVVRGLKVPQTAVVCTGEWLEARFVPVFGCLKL